ncbi:MAG: Nucleoid-associated protein [Chlamydiia bacterium]|nr:Nucleoid-associated protein [Chlamydiia bacterium]
MGSGFAKKKKQQKMMQEQMQKMQEQMQSTIVTGSSGNGLVEVDMNGEKSVVAIRVKPDCVDPEDTEGLEDLIVAACQDAEKKIEDNNPLGDIGSLMGGLGF